MGLSAEEALGTGQFNTVQIRTLLFSNERRFAEEKSFLLWGFDQQRRDSVTVKISSRDTGALLSWSFLRGLMKSSVSQQKIELVLRLLS